MLHVPSSSGSLETPSGLQRTLIRRLGCLNVARMEQEMNDVVQIASRRGDTGPSLT